MYEFIWTKYLKTQFRRRNTWETHHYNSFRDWMRATAEGRTLAAQNTPNVADAARDWFKRKRKGYKR